MRFFLNSLNFVKVSNFDKVGFVPKTILASLYFSLADLADKADFF
jgi:hypothetical protein